MNTFDSNNSSSGDDSLHASDAMSFDASIDAMSMDDSPAASGGGGDGDSGGSSAGGGKAKAKAKTRRGKRGGKKKATAKKAASSKPDKGEKIAKGQVPVAVELDDDESEGDADEAIAVSDAQVENERALDRETGEGGLPRAATAPASSSFIAAVPARGAEPSSARRNEGFVSEPGMGSGSMQAPEALEAVEEALSPEMASPPLEGGEIATGEMAEAGEVSASVVESLHAEPAPRMPREDGEPVVHSGPLVITPRVAEEDDEDDDAVERSAPEPRQRPRKPSSSGGKRQLLINYVPGEECRVAVVQGGKLEEFHSERNDQMSHVGSIYVGRVTNVEPAIQAAFVDFGIGNNGFLHTSDLHPRYFPGEGSGTTERVGKKVARRDRPPIQDCLRRGQEIIVQVLKEGVGSKGPTLTSYLSIPGRYLVMMPGMDRVGVSRKVEDEDLRKKTKQILDQLDLPEGFGFIVRTAGLDKSRAELKRDLAYLMRLQKDMERRRQNGTKPRLLYSESDLLLRSLRDMMTMDTDEVVIDSEHGIQRAARFVQIVSPRTETKLIHYTGRTPIYHAFNVEPQIRTMFGREVPLPSGGRLVIDETEALVAIDVNSGKHRDASDSETNALKTNLEAIEEIARQLRLRDLGGIVVNDLIDMRYARHRDEVQQKFADLLKNDRARTTLLGISEFGTLEITRQRVRGSHESIHFHACPSCHGRGLVQRPDSVAADALRELAALMDNDKVRRVEMVIHPRVAAELLSAKRKSLSRIEKQFGKVLSVRLSEAVAPDRVTFYAYDEQGADLEIERMPRFRLGEHVLRTLAIPQGDLGEDDGRDVPLIDEVDAVEDEILTSDAFSESDSALLEGSLDSSAPNFVLETTSRGKRGRRGGGGGGGGGQGGGDQRQGSSQRAGNNNSGGGGGNGGQGQGQRPQGQQAGGGGGGPQGPRTGNAQSNGRPSGAPLAQGPSNQQGNRGPNDRRPRPQGPGGPVQGGMPNASQAGNAGQGGQGHRGAHVAQPGQKPPVRTPSATGGLAAMFRAESFMPTPTLSGATGDAPSSQDGGAGAPAAGGQMTGDGGDQDFDLSGADGQGGANAGFDNGPELGPDGQPLPGGGRRKRRRRRGGRGRNRGDGQGGGGGGPDGDGMNRGPGTQGTPSGQGGENAGGGNRPARSTGPMGWPPAPGMEDVPPPADFLDDDIDDRAVNASWGTKPAPANPARSEPGNDGQRGAANGPERSGEFDDDGPDDDREPSGDGSPAGQGENAGADGGDGGPRRKRRRRRGGRGRNRGDGQGGGGGEGGQGDQGQSQGGQGGAQGQGAPQGQGQRGGGDRGGQGPSDRDQSRGGGGGRPPSERAGGPSSGGGSGGGAPSAGAKPAGVPTPGAPAVPPKRTLYAAFKRLKPGQLPRGGREE
jgi:ribonuclease E